MIQGIQIIGTQRSGSNLLRLMLNQIDQVDAPHPPHILQRFYPLLGLYGDLNIENHFLKLIQDVCKLIELNPVPWKGLKLDPESIKYRCRANTLPEIFRVVYELKAESTGADFWCCKSMANIHYANDLDEAGLKPLYIHLFRDGRDVALSFKKAIVGQKHMYHIARQWIEEQELSQCLVDELGTERAIQISYEEMIQNPADCMQKLCDFLNIPYHEKVLSYYNSEDSVSTAESGEMWQNLTKPIMTNNFNKFVHELSREDISIFETIAGETLTRLGYRPHLHLNGSKRDFTELEILGFTDKNELLKKKAVKNAKEEDLINRAGQKDWMEEIKSQTHR